MNRSVRPEEPPAEVLDDDGRHGAGPGVVERGHRALDELNALR